MGMGFAPTWLRQVSPPPASQNHFNPDVNERVSSYSWFLVRVDFQDTDVRTHVVLHGPQRGGVRQLDQGRSGPRAEGQLRVPAGEHDERVRDAAQL